MPPKKVNGQKKSSGVVPDTPRSPKTARTAPDAQAPAAAAAPPPVAAPERPRASFVSAYFFAASFVVRSILVPLYGAMDVSGIISRWSYPTHYTAPGVTCAVEALDGPKFCEHELIFEHEGVALLSCDSGRGEWNTVMGPLLNPEPKGQLWLYDYADTKTSQALDLTGFPAQYDFHPLGIASFSDALKTSLFVINHQRTGPSIEVFTLSLGKGSGRVEYERSIKTDPLIKSANGIVAIDHTHLYVTNDHAWTRLESGTGWAVTETFTGSLYGQSWITHIDLSSPITSQDADGQHNAVLTKVYQGMAFANGLALGSDGTLYAASSVAGTVSLLRTVNDTTPILGFAGELSFGYSIDNVHIIKGQKIDRILVGGHPSFLALSRLSRSPHDASVTSPSWISLAQRKTPDEEAAKRVKKEKVEGQTWHEGKWSKGWHIDTVYEDDGSHFSSSTGAALDIGRDILISPGLYETGVLVCRGVSTLLR